MLIIETKSISISAAVADTSAGDDKDLKDLLAWAE